MKKLATTRHPTLRRITFFCLISVAELTLSQAPGNAAAQGTFKSKPAGRSARGVEVENNAPKLTAEQERGLRLLKAAEAEAAGLEPDMHAFVLWRASFAYEKVDPKKAEKVALAAFTAAQSIEDAPSNDYCRTSGSAGDVKTNVELRVLSAMIKKGQITEVEQLLPQATEWVRDQIASGLVSHYIQGQEFAKAEATLSQVSDSKHYPFSAAADLIVAMGPELSGERMTLFQQALSNYEQNSKELGFNTGDIGDFVERTWSMVPSELALEAVNRLLDDAKSSDSQTHVNMTTSTGSVALNSGYEYRLFQLVPVLQELDKDKAEELLRDNAETKARLAKYPKGMQSLTAQGNVYSSYSSGTGSPRESEFMAKQQAMAQMQQRTAAIVKEAEKDPAQALNDAQSLPVQDGVSSPRANALLEIAEYAGKRKSSVAKSVLEQVLSFEEQLTTTEISMSRISRIPKMYLELGDEDGARKAIKALLKAAEKVYASDTNADDPNRGFKGTWPSADLWRKCVQASAQISPAMAEEVIAEIPDPDIAGAEKVAFASSLLGVAGEPVIVGECRKSGSSYSVSQ